MSWRYRQVPDEHGGYIGKHYVWTPKSEARAQALALQSLPAKKIADAINREFPQPNLVTTSSVIGKLNRLRRAA